MYHRQHTEKSPQNNILIFFIILLIVDSLVKTVSGVYRQDLQSSINPLVLVTDDIICDGKSIGVYY